MKYDNYYVVVDVETGGIPKKLKKRAVIDVALVELAFVVISNVDLKIVEKKSWIFKPYKDGLIYTKEASMVCGMDEEFCQKNGVDMQTAFAEISAFVEKYKRGRLKPILVGHNISGFDIDFIIELFNFNKKDAANYFDPNIEDTMIHSRRKWIESVNFKLPTCCKLARITLKDAHRALADTIATAKLWIYLVHCMRGGVPSKSQGKIDVDQQGVIW